MDDFEIDEDLICDIQHAVQPYSTGVDRFADACIFEDNMYNGEQVSAEELTMDGEDAQRVNFKIERSQIEKEILAMFLDRECMTLREIIQIWEDEWGIQNAGMIKFLSEGASTKYMSRADPVPTHPNVIKIQCKAGCVLTSLAVELKQRGGKVKEGKQDHCESWPLASKAFWASKAEPPEAPPQPASSKTHAPLKAFTMPRHRSRISIIAAQRRTKVEMAGEEDLAAANTGQLVTKLENGTKGPPNETQDSKNIITRKTPIDSEAWPLSDPSNEYSHQSVHDATQKLLPWERRQAEYSSQKEQYLSSVSHVQKHDSQVNSAHRKATRLQDLIDEKLDCRESSDISAAHRSQSDQLDNFQGSICKSNGTRSSEESQLPRNVGTGVVEQASKDLGISNKWLLTDRTKAEPIHPLAEKQGVLKQPIETTVRSQAHGAQPVPKETEEQRRRRLEREARLEQNRKRKEQMAEKLPNR